MNHAPPLTIKGHPLRMKLYDGPLYRADDKERLRRTPNLIKERNIFNSPSKFKKEYELNIGANKIYGTHYHKFFATNQAETNTYLEPIEKGYVMKWIPSEPLYLIDIMNLETRLALETLLGNELLNIAFPIVHNTVYRYSEVQTAQLDAQLLAELCRLHLSIDGYYMKRQSIPANDPVKKQKITSMHSEIGLCSSAFEKLQLKQVRYRVQAQRPQGEAEAKKNQIRNQKKLMRPLAFTVKKPNRNQMKRKASNHTIHKTPTKKVTGRSMLFANNNNSNKNENRKGNRMMLNLSNLENLS
jgi:hypothetical protein